MNKVTARLTRGLRWAILHTEPVLEDKMIAWAKEVLRRTAGVIEWLCRRTKNKPITSFRWIGIPAGKAVGEPIQVRHFSSQNMRDWAVYKKLTKLALLRGLKINAVQVLDSKKLGEDVGITTIQPRHI